MPKAAPLHHRVATLVEARAPGRYTPGKRRAIPTEPSTMKPVSYVGGQAFGNPTFDRAERSARVFEGHPADRQRAVLPPGRAIGRRAHTLREAEADAVRELAAY